MNHSLLTIFLLFLLILNSQPSKSTSSEVECTTAADCGDNFTCNPFGECVCLFDFIEIDSSPKSICLHLRCARNATCHYHFGTASFCGQPGRRCLCPRPLLVDPIDQKCHRLLGAVCGADTDCGGDAVCATGPTDKDNEGEDKTSPSKAHPKTCICKSGTIPDALRLNCNPFVCNFDSDCVEHFGADYHCHKKPPTNSTNSHNFQNHCDCKAHRDAWINPQTQRCEPRANACTKVGSVPVDFEQLEDTGASSEACKELVCDEDTDCDDLFPHTICDEEAKRCHCSGSGFFELNKDGTKCVFKAVLGITFGIIGAGLVAFGIGGACYWKWGGVY